MHIAQQKCMQETVLKLSSAQLELLAWRIEVTEPMS